MDFTTTIDAVLEGDKDKFRLLIQHCNQPLYRTAIVILKNEVEAEDALQTTYLKAYLHLVSFRKESSFLTWITRILINECRMVLRKQRKVTSLETEEVMQQPSLTENAMDTIYNGQVNQLLEQAIMSLPEKYKLVYVVREVNEMSTEKTAEVLELTQENVKVRLHRAKSLIRENLLKQVKTSELFPFGKSRCANLTDKVMKSIEHMPRVHHV